jgi:8-oxo-dGTP pyrophosphatase MutT (NUDIX family)
MPAIPLPASTVVLVRPDAERRFEIYLNRRPEQMDTYAGVYVFPGGRVEASDWSTAMISLTRGVTPDEAQKKFGVDLRPELCLGYWVAAVRELFEEVGIHFFRSESETDGAQPQQTLLNRVAAERAALQRGEIAFADFLLSQRLYCDLARLHYIFHRITPEHYRVRFDTRFYLAALPSDQSPFDAVEEVSESLWISPERALERYQAGNFPMMPPTLLVLRSLSAHRTWEELRDAFDLR